MAIRFVAVLGLLAFQSSAYADVTPQIEIVSVPETVEDGTRERIQERLETTLPSVGTCVGEDPFRALTFELVVDRDGRVRRVSEPSASSEVDVARCVRDLLQRLRFDPLSGDTTLSIRVSQVESAMLLGSLFGAGGAGGVGLRGVGVGGGAGMTSQRSRVVAGNAAVRGSLSREVIRRVIRQHINRVRYCYERALVQDASLAGRITISFIIAASGNIQSATATSDTVGNPAVSSCVVQVVRSMRFPAPTGGGVVAVTYPFIFRAPSNASAMTATPSMTPVVRTGTAQVQGRLARADILRVVRQNQAAVRYCYEVELQRNADLAGRLVVRFEVLATGRVGSASVTGNTTGNAAVAACVQRQIRRWRFPQPEGGGSVTVSYPFVFTTR